MRFIDAYQASLQEFRRLIASGDAAGVVDSMTGAPVTITRGGSTVGYQLTIQDGINYAVAGDVVAVAAGTYTEQFTINKAVTVQGPNASVAGNGTRVAEAGHNTMTAGGGGGIGGAALYFKEVNFDESICSGSPVSGVMMYRQPGGGWYAFELAEDCSGCGQVIWNEDTDLGSACVDFKRTTTLLTGMGDP